MCFRELFFRLLLVTQILQIAECEQQHFRFQNKIQILITLLTRHSSYQILIGGNLKR